MTPPREGFAQLYEEHVWTVYGYIGYRVAGKEQAEDLTQQTFERALRAWSRFDRSRASADTWLLTIARNLVIDHYRRNAARPVASLDDEEAPELAAPEPRGSALGPAPELEAALRRLSDRDREAIALRFGGDLTGPEIAEMMGLTLANVQQILSRSLRRLRQELEQDEPTGASTSR